MLRLPAVPSRIFLVTLAAASLGVASFLLDAPIEKIGAGQEERGQQASSTAMPAPRPPPGPRAKGILEVRVGPGEDYNVVGLIPANARLEVAGRDETGEWLSIALNPGSKLHGWVPRDFVSGLTDFGRLEVVPVTLPPQ